MYLTQETAITAACSILSLVYRARGDYSRPSDGFCVECPASKYDQEWRYQNDGHVLKYVLEAVVSQLRRDGLTPDAKAVKYIEDLLGNQ